MSQPVLQVHNVGKAYYQYRSELFRVMSWFGLAHKPAIQHWVLQGISFSVSTGEAVGIVGQNGAGKSTLLKLITGTQQPTTGHIQVNGRIGAILELGMGFNPEFTGRQNTYHSAGLMGFSKAEIGRMVPEIQAFAEIGDYFDQPVNTYSSGMQMRVAFAVITAVRPDILIVDEALSVGDTYFQHKSFSRIQDFQRQGTTLLVVSHDRNAIQALCDRAILLENGILTKDGNPEEVMDFYRAIITEREESTIQVKPLESGKVQTVYGTREAHVDTVEILDREGNPIDYINVGEPVNLRIKVVIEEKIPTLVLGYLIKDRLGQNAYGTNSWHAKQVIHNLRQGELVIYNIHFNMNLGVGSYSITTALVSSEQHLIGNYEWHDLVHVFNVVNKDKSTFSGTAWLQPTFIIDREETSEV
jgi:lipopolysaccharide transport system ATP-binding protein